MAIRDILVHLDSSAAASARLELAILYARKHGAKLRGLYPIPNPYYEPRDLEEESNAERFEQLFGEKTAAAGIASEWVGLDLSAVGASATDIVLLRAYYTDLVIVGQTNYRSPSRNVPTDLPERLVMACGRPVLVVPYAGSFATAADRIMIAWKAGRESVRSINDALPHLEKARFVSVIRAEDATAAGTSGHTMEIIGFLAEHKVAARVDQVCTGNNSIADMLLNLTCENAVDLLVMGVYAPTLRGNTALSPVARHVLKHLAVPVLMSH